MTIWVCDSPPDILLYSLPVVASTSNEAEPDAGQLNEPSRESSFATFSAHDPGTGLTSYDPPPALLPAHISQQHRSSSVEVYCYMKGLRHPVLEPLLDSSAIGLLSLSPLRLAWWNEDLQKGFAVDYTALSLHALTRRFSSEDNRPALYFQLSERSNVYWMSDNGSLSLLMGGIDKALNHSACSSICSSTASSMSFRSHGRPRSSSTSSIPDMSKSCDMPKKSKRLSMTVDMEVEPETDPLEVYFVPHDPSLIDNLFETLCHFYSAYLPSEPHESMFSIAEEDAELPGESELIERFDHLPSAFQSPSGSEINNYKASEILDISQSSIYTPSPLRFDSPGTLRRKVEAQDEKASNESEPSTVACWLTERIDSDNKGSNDDFYSKRSKITVLTDTYASILNEAEEKVTDESSSKKEEKASPLQREVKEMNPHGGIAGDIVRDELEHILESEPDAVDSVDEDILRDVLALSSPRVSGTKKLSSIGEHDGVVDLTKESSGDTLPMNDETKTNEKQRDVIHIEDESDVNTDDYNPENEVEETDNIAPEEGDEDEHEEVILSEEEDEDMEEDESSNKMVHEHAWQDSDTDSEKENYTVNTIKNPEEIPDEPLNEEVPSHSEDEPSNPEEVAEGHDSPAEHENDSEARDSAMEDEHDEVGDQTALGSTSHSDTEVKGRK